MTKLLRGLSVLIVITLIVLLSPGAPASPITAEVAKKCREMAIKAHPYQPPGTKGNYAAAEREYFRDCTSRESNKQK